jgi:hypothetical protein
MKYLTFLLKKVDVRVLIGLLTILSLVSIVFFYFAVNSHGAGFTDAYSRLNISRRITDSLTPGLAQIGGVWLPLPQVFIAPFAAINFLYFSSLAPIFVSAPSYILGGYFMYQLVRRANGEIYDYAKNNNGVYSFTCDTESDLVADAPTQNNISYGYTLSSQYVFAPLPGLYASFQ